MLSIIIPAHNEEAWIAGCLAPVLAEPAPAGGGEIVVAVFVKARGGESRDRAIAQVARAAHDYFLFVPGR